MKSMDALKKKGPKILGISVISLGALYGIINVESIGLFFGHAFEDSVIKAGFAFTVAAFIHSGRVRKEIANQFTALRMSIESVADALKKDLASQSERIGSVENGVNKLTTRVESLEKKGD